MTEFIYRGTIIEIFSLEEKTKNYFMLVENFGNDFLFQIVRLDGYHRGCCQGYVRHEDHLKNQSIRAITKEFLLKEFKRSITDFKIESFNILKNEVALEL